MQSSAETHMGFFFLLGIWWWYRHCGPVVFLSFAPGIGDRFSYLPRLCACIDLEPVLFVCVAFHCGLLPIDLRWQYYCCCCFLAAIYHMGSSGGGGGGWHNNLFGFPMDYNMALDYSACLPPIIPNLEPWYCTGGCNDEVCAAKGSIP